MVKLKVPQNLNQFEKEKLCNLLECNDPELDKLYNKAKSIFKETFFCKIVL